MRVQMSNTTSEFRKQFDAYFQETQELDRSLNQLKRVQQSIAHLYFNLHEIMATTRPSMHHTCVLCATEFHGPGIEGQKNPIYDLDGSNRDMQRSAYAGLKGSFINVQNRL